MNFKRSFVKLAVLCLLLLFVVESCKKKREFKEENGQAAEDVRGVQGNNDAAVKDVNVTLMEQSLLRGRSASQQATDTVRTELCGVEVDTLSVFSGITHLHYNGISCNGTTKTGDIIITIMNYPLKKWKNAGCVLKIDFIAYKVTLADGKSIMLEGTEYLKNETGGTWYEMRYLNATNLVQTHTANDMKVTYDGKSTATFNINRKLTFNYSGKNITSCMVEGIGSSNGLDDLDNWGQNRDGNKFTTQITSPVLWNSTCGNTSPVDGELSVKVDGKDFELKCKFAVDADGNSVSNGTSCPFGWKVSWSYKKNTSSRVIAYN